MHYICMSYQIRYRDTLLTKTNTSARPILSSNHENDRQKFIRRMVHCLLIIIDVPHYFCIYVDASRRFGATQFLESLL